MCLYSKVFKLFHSELCYEQVVLFLSLKQLRSKFLHSNSSKTFPSCSLSDKRAKRAFQAVLNHVTDFYCSCTVCSFSDTARAGLGNFLCSVHTNAALTLAVQCLLTQQSGNEIFFINWRPKFFANCKISKRNCDRNWSFLKYFIFVSLEVVWICGVFLQGCCLCMCVCVKCWDYRNCRRPGQCSAGLFESLLPWLWPCSRSAPLLWPSLWYPNTVTQFGQFIWDFILICFCTCNTYIHAQLNTINMDLQTSSFCV